MRRAGYLSTFSFVLVAGAAAAVVVLPPEVAQLTEAAGQDTSGVIGPDSVELGATTADWVVAENAKPGASRWRIGRTRGSAAGLEVFSDQISVVTGEQVTLRASGRGTATIAAYRTGWYGGRGARLVWRGSTTVSPQPAAAIDNGPVAGLAGVANTRMRRASWRATTTLPTSGWLPGHYLIRVDLGAASRYVPLTVRSPSLSGRLVLANATMTWQAYNQWGGADLYKGPNGAFSTRSYAVSYDRPYLSGYGSGQYLYREFPLVEQAERAGLNVAYATDVDLATRTGEVPRATGIVFGSHSEYWTRPLRNALQQAVDSGANLAVFGANTGYWRVRLGGLTNPLKPRVVFAPKAAALDPLRVKDPRGTTVKFKNAPHAVAEDLLFGHAYDCFPIRGDLVVNDPGWWGYRRTGITKGTRLVGVVGPESDRVYLRPGRPTPSQVVTYSTLPCAGGRTPVTSVYLSRPSGAGVFAAGTMDWVPSLASGPQPTRGYLQQITTTILTEFATPRAGARLPARDTAGKYHLPPRRTTSYGG